MKEVGPMNKMKIRKSSAKRMLTTLKKRTPLSNPNTTEVVAANVMQMMSVICVFVVFSIPNRYSKPEPICCTPIPKVVARPKSVAITASTSIRCPQKPLTLFPISGRNKELIVSGYPLLKVKNAKANPMIT